MTRDAPMLTLGFSSCPNDTFMFHALVHGRVDLGGLCIEVVMEDIEALNRRALAEHDEPPLAFTKMSVAALGHVTDRYAALDAGAALGRGCGPLVLRRGADERLGSLEDLRGRTIAIPGDRTTAHLLFRSFGPSEVEVVPMRFDAIMPAVARGRCDAGLVIHESRFTYPDWGLACIADLGELWEADTGLPLPLGVIVADRRLDSHLVDRFETALRDSVVYAREHPAESRPYVRTHAQEMSDDVCDRHIALYVNESSVSLGDEGRAAIETLLARGRASGLLPASQATPWRR
jgi:1,4-dihydroxy-6-naphthoate synthase